MEPHKRKEGRKGRAENDMAALCAFSADETIEGQVLFWISGKTEAHGREMKAR